MVKSVGRKTEQSKVLEHIEKAGFFLGQDVMSESIPM